MEFSHFYTIDSMQGFEGLTDDRFPMTHKFIRDGLLLILRGDRTYTLQGQEVR